jgi:hypothetical protein
LARQTEQSAPKARQSRNFFAPTVGDRVRFVTWDLQLARSYGWVALLGCLMIGAAARLFRILWLRQLTLIWLTSLLVAIVLAPAAWTMILGGMLTGSLLSVLVPRRWMQQQDFLARSGRASRSSRELAAIALLLLLSNVSSGKVPDGDASVGVTSQSQAEIPLYLLASAEYEITQTSPNPAVHAKFKIFSKRQSADVFVLLPLQNIVFAADAECLVNGRQQSVIPAVSGEGLVINLGHADPEPAEKKPVGEWVESLVELDFVMRAGPVGAEADAMPFRAVVPAILDSRVIVPKKLEPVAIQHWGSSHSDSNQRVIDLGGLGKLWSQSPNQEQSAPVGTTAVSQLECSPLRIIGRTRITPGSHGWESELPLSFPKGCLMTSVTGASVIDWIELPESLDLAHYVVRLRQDVPASPFVVAFELPADDAPRPDAQIPAIPLWSGSSVPHAIGLNCPPATRFSLISTPGVSELTAEEWQSLSESPRARPLVTVFLKTPQAISLRWSQLSPQRQMSIAETFLVRRESLEWTATLKTSIGQVPAFRHQLLLDPAMRINSVVTGERGSEGSVRFSREGNQLTLFLPGGQLGERTFVVTGRMPFSVDTWSPVPELEAVGTLVSDRQLSILDETYWNVELEAAEGERIPINSVAPSRGSTGPRTIAEFSKGQIRPMRMRTSLPIDATKAECVTLLKTPADGDWELISAFHLDAVESSLRKVVFFVPQEFSAIRVRPSLFQHTQVPAENGTTVTIKVPDRYSSAATVTLAVRISSQLREQLLEERQADRSAAVVPAIEILSARKGSQLILLSRNSPLQLAPGGVPRITADAFPLWAPAEWMQDVRANELLCSQQIRRELAVQRKSAAESGSEPVIRLEETAVWVLENGQQRGITHLWLTTREAEHLQIVHGEDLQIDEAICDETGPLKQQPSTGGTQLTLPPEESQTSLAIHWSRKSSHSGIQLPGFGTEQPLRRLVAIVHPDGTRTASAGAIALDRLEIWLLRWEALLKCLDHLPTSLSVDGVLLQNVRLCQKECETIVQDSAIVPVDQLRLFERLSAEWKNRKSDLVVSSTPAAARVPEYDNSFVDLLQNDAASLHVTWLSPPMTNWQAEIHRAIVPGRLWKGIAGLAMLLVVVCVVRLFSKPIHRLRDMLSGYPALSFLSLGLVWWILLEPSALGLLMIVASLGWICVQGLYRLVRGGFVQDPRSV